jgi:hypothetical protein
VRLLLLLLIKVLVTTLALALPLPFPLSFRESTHHRLAALQLLLWERNGTNDGPFQACVRQVLFPIRSLLSANRCSTGGFGCLDFNVPSLDVQNNHHSHNHDCGNYHEYPVSR